eukprot:s1285_g16.t3
MTLYDECHFLTEKTQSKWPEYAVKVINTKTMEELGYEASVNREICVLKMLSHPGIARMVAAFRYRDGAYLVLEYAHKGDLHNMLCSLGKLQEDVARFFVGEVVAALCAIHDTGFVYSDLKPENVVITSSNHAKLTDFGGCRPITDEAAANCRRALLKRLRDGDWRAQDAPEVEISECEEEIIDDGRVEGTMIYLPPEVVKGGMPTLASDAWALGCLLYQLLTGRPPVWADSELEEEIKSRIVSFQLDDGIAQKNGLPAGNERHPAWGFLNWACGSTWFTWGKTRHEMRTRWDGVVESGLTSGEWHVSGRKVRIEGFERAEAAPLQEFRRLLGQLEQQMLARTGHGMAGDGTGHSKVLKMYMRDIAQLRQQVGQSTGPGQSGPVGPMGLSAKKLGRRNANLLKKDDDTRGREEESDAENSTSSAMGNPRFDSQLQRASWLWIFDWDSWDQLGPAKFPSWPSPPPRLATVRTSDEPAPPAGADLSYSGESEAESSQATMKSTPLTTVKESLSSRRSSESLKEDEECHPEDVTHEIREEDLPKAKSAADKSLQSKKQDTRFRPGEELVMGLLIIANSISMFVEFEFQGYVVGHSLDYPRMQKPPEQVWPSAQTIFDTMNLTFTIIFLVDIVLRIGFLRCPAQLGSQFFRLSFNWLDFLVVFCSVVEILFEELLPLDTVFIRLLRLGKVARAIRVVRQTEGMSSLIMLLKCASWNTLCWSLSFIVVLQCIAGMVISQVVSQYMTDDRISPEARRAVFRYYGTFTSTFLTMFEVLLANWAPAARILDAQPERVDNVSDLWVYVFVVYRCVVGFAILNEQILGRSGDHLEIEMTARRSGSNRSTAREEKSRKRSRKEQLLIWLQGEELFHRSSSLEQSITYSIFSILCVCVCFTVLHSFLFGKACEASPPPDPDPGPVSDGSRPYLRGGDIAV